MTAQVPIGLSRQPWTRWPLEALTLLSAVAALASAALLNGFPLLFPDSGFFLIMSADFEVPWNRPIFYGLFLAPIQRLFGLWGIVFAQSAITVAVLHLFLRTCTRREGPFTLAIVLALTVGSSLPWFVGMIMPDLFQPFLVLTLYLLAFRWTELGAAARVFCLALFLLSTVMHYVNFIVAAGLVAILAAWFALNKRPEPRAVAAMACTTALAIALQVGVNVIGYGRPSLSEGTPAYLLSRLVETGLADKFLDAHCDTEEYVLCDYRGQYHTHGGWYIFSKDSPFYTVWNERRPITEHVDGAHRSEAESRAIIYGTLREYPLDVLWQMVVATARQLVQFNSAEGVQNFIGRDYLEEPLLTYFPESRAAFLTARQHHGELPVVPARLLHLVVALVCAFLVLLLLFRGYFRRSWLGPFLSLSAAAYVINAAGSGILAGETHRYGSRMIWLLVLIATLAAWDSLRRPAESANRSPFGDEKPVRG